MYAALSFFSSATCSSAMVALFPPPRSPEEEDADEAVEAEAIPPLAASRRGRRFLRTPLPLKLMVVRWRRLR